MKGIILAGGFGTRLYPLTKITSKHLLPVYDKQMIFYPIETLAQAGIKDILIISDPGNIDSYKKLLEDGSSLGVQLSYLEQEKPRGLPEAFIIGADFIGDDSVALILGDNIFEDSFTDAVASFKRGGRIFAKEVHDPERFGVVEFDEHYNVISIEEKPTAPKSTYAIPGFYLFDARVVDFAKKLTPSARGELEIVDIQKKYLSLGELDVRTLTGDWVDAGTFDSLHRATLMVKEKKHKKKEDDTTRPKVTVITVTYGKRWKYLSQVVAAVMRDPHVRTFIIVDNGSHNKEEIEEGVRIYGDKVMIIRNEKNTGSAGGFARAFEVARTTDSEYVLALDDDNVPEEDAISEFLTIRKRIPDKNVVLVGNRINIPGNTDFFYQEPIKNQNPKGTFFEMITFRKVETFFKLLLGLKTSRKNEFILVAPNESFAYGGSFIPMDAIRRAPLPDADLVLYGDDIEYSWGIKRLGYSSYVCYAPKIYDLDMSFGDGSQVVGLFDPKSAYFKIYYRIRNMVRISIRNTKQWQVTLFINILIWMTALAALGLIRYGLSRDYVIRIKLMIQAVYGGYVPHMPTPDLAVLP